MRLQAQEQDQREDIYREELQEAGASLDQRERLNVSATFLTFNLQIRLEQH